LSFKVFLLLRNAINLAILPRGPHSLSNFIPLWDYNSQMRQVPKKVGDLAGFFFWAQFHFSHEAFFFFFSHLSHLRFHTFLSIPMRKKMPKYNSYHSSFNYHCRTSHSLMPSPISAKRKGLTVSTVTELWKPRGAPKGILAGEAWQGRGATWRTARDLTGVPAERVRARARDRWRDEARGNIF